MTNLKQYIEMPALESRCHWISIYSFGRMSLLGCLSSSNALLRPSPTQFWGGCMTWNWIWMNLLVSLCIQNSQEGHGRINFKSWWRDQSAMRDWRHGFGGNKWWETICFSGLLIYSFLWCSTIVIYFLAEEWNSLSRSFSNECEVVLFFY